MAELLLARRHASRGSTRARTCSRRRGGASATASRSSRGRRRSSPFPTPPSTISRSPTCCATSTIPGRRSQELARVVRRGGTIASLEFCVPRGIWRRLWDLYVGIGLPVAGRLISPGWYEVGRFLGPSIRSFYDAVAARAPARAVGRGRHRGRAGAAAEPRGRRGDLGESAGEAGVLRAAPGRLARLRDAAARAVHRLASLLRRRRRLPRGGGPVGQARAHGARLLPRDGDRRARARRARGPAARTTIPAPVLIALASARSPRPARSGSPSRSTSASGSLPLIAVGAFLVPAYNLELFGGRFHSDLWFGLAWGAFPVVTAYVACAGHAARSPRSSRPHGRRCSRSPSGGSRPPCGAPAADVVAVTGRAGAAGRHARAGHARDCSSPRPRPPCGCSRSRPSSSRPLS